MFTINWLLDNIFGNDDDHHHFKEKIGQVKSDMPDLTIILLPV